MNAIREKVRNGLEQCANDEIPESCKRCPYFGNGVMCMTDLARDALEVLREQESRVLTLEEVLVGDECWFEYINGSRGYADVYVQDNRTAIIYRTTTRPVEVSLTDYIKKWRCWSYRPTEEQRKAVKWDGVQ